MVFAVTFLPGLQCRRSGLNLRCFTSDKTWTTTTHKEVLRRRFDRSVGRVALGKAFYRVPDQSAEWHSLILINALTQGVSKNSDRNHYWEG